MARAVAETLPLLPIDDHLAVMGFTRSRRFAVLLPLLVAVAAGCGTHPSAPTSSSSANRATASAPVPATVASQLDARWMGVVPNQPPGWQVVNRMMTGDFQQFDFRPVDETEFMRGCNGCAPWTADRTAHAPGRFDPTDARAGLPVSVNETNDGFFRPADESADWVSRAFPTAVRASRRWPASTLTATLVDRRRSRRWPALQTWPSRVHRSPVVPC